MGPDQFPVLNPGDSDLVSIEVKRVIDRLKKFDGSLIPIPNIRSLVGEELYVATRLSSVRNLSAQVLGIDIVAKRDNNYIPVAMKYI